MKNIITGVAVAVAILATLVVADSLYFSCECFYGAVITNSNPTCTCDCTGATLVDGQSAIGNYCAYGKYGTVQLSVVTNETNSSTFSGATLERSLQKIHGCLGNATALSYVKVDDTNRGLTNFFTPNIVAVFQVSNGSMATTVLNYAKTTSLYDAHYAPLGIQEVEVFFLEAGPTSGMVTTGLGYGISTVWIVMPIVAILITLCECCFAKKAKKIKKSDAEKTAYEKKCEASD